MGTNSPQLPDRFVSSPFADYANATLRFPVETDVLITDPKTGNVSAQTAIVLVSAMLKEKKDSARSQELPGIDRASLRLEGRAIEPLAMPSIIAPYTRAEATWQGHRGEFVLEPGGQSPYGVADILGDKISGLFRISDFKVEGDPYVIPTPTPATPGDTYETTFTQSSLSIANLLPVAHGLNTYPSSIAIWDENNELITPDDIQHQSVNALAIDLTSFAPITGVWTLSIGS